jgi:hypothetical protein
MKDVWNNFKYYRMAIGITMMWNPFPIIFSIRDGLRIGGGSLFTLAFYILALTLFFPVNVFKKIYLPNPLLFFFLFGFIILAAIYMVYYPTLLYNYRGNLSREIITYLLPVLYLFATMYFPNHKTEIMIPIIILYTLVGSMGLLWGIAHDPNWHFGERAAIKFLANTDNSNPHAFANNALYGVLAGFIGAAHSKSTKVQFFYYLCIVFQIVILILCRTNTSIVALGIIGAIYVLTNPRKIMLDFFRVRTAYVAGVLVFFVWVFFRYFKSVRLIIEIYFGLLTDRFINMVYTASGVKLSNQQSVSIDESAVNRVYSFRYLVKMFRDGRWKDIIIGEGYKSQFLDVPFIEALTNHGILGFILFTGFFLAIALTAFFEILRPSNPFATFLAYFSIVLLVMGTTGSRPVDVGMWLVYLTYVRFLGIHYSSPKIGSESV